MKTIHVPPTVQLIGLLGILGAIVALVLAQAPEIQRYMKVRAMD